MTISQEKIFQAKQQLETDIQELEKKLQALIARQAKITKIDDYARSILEYEELQHQIEDRAHVFSLLSLAPDSLRVPFIKSELFSYFVAAETVGPELVNLLVDEFIAQVRVDMIGGEDTAVDLVQAEYKEYMLPGKMMAQAFDEIDLLIAEMNRLCMQCDSTYDAGSAERVLVYAFRAAIDADITLDPLIHALKETQFSALTEADRAQLLDAVEERLAVLRFERTKRQNIAMEKAIVIMEKRDSDAPSGAA